MSSYLIYSKGCLGVFDAYAITDNRAKALEYSQKYGYGFMRLPKI